MFDVNLGGLSVPQAAFLMHSYLKELKSTFHADRGVLVVIGDREVGANAMHGTIAAGTPLIVSDFEKREYMRLNGRKVVLRDSEWKGYVLFADAAAIALDGQRVKPAALEMVLVMLEKMAEIEGKRAAGRVRKALGLTKRSISEGIAAHKAEEAACRS